MPPMLFQAKTWVFPLSGSVITWDSAAQDDLILSSLKRTCR